ncbi:SH3 domain-containing protein [Helicobacter sp. MIT 05-5294]|uniref:SH3 domain-containing protein n=1 Tax=Helicobacter sp. MIT 05-5294 TaxID=1548150 RepID=UPI00051FB610|nr:SH3 domain-containing protein [Helicobacter sp. MIT 05-5294]TLD85434.1 SH3 domain-containing protein [Helicobacter sp. MIT 05-5294]
MLKTAILCTIGGILFLCVGNFGGDFIGFFKDSKKAQKVQTKPCLYVQSSALNIRNAPNLEAKITEKLQQNTPICEYSNTQNDFLQIQQGWVATKYLSLTPRKPPPAKATKDESAQDSMRLVTLESPKILKDSKGQLGFKLTSTAKPTESTLFYQKQAQDSAQDSVLEQIIQARIEMDNKNYAQAKNLALRVNLNNPKNLESWEIFAKSLYLEGNAQEAILILQNFLQQNYDKNLALLLKSMRQGQKI